MCQTSGERKDEEEDGEDKGHSFKHRCGSWVVVCGWVCRYSLDNDEGERKRMQKKKLVKSFKDVLASRALVLGGCGSGERKVKGAFRPAPLVVNQPAVRFPPVEYPFKAYPRTL